MDSLILKKGGIILSKEWKYDEKIGEGNYVIEVLSSEKTQILKLLFLEIELEENYTLRDMFLMLDNYPDLQKIVTCNEELIDSFYKCPKSGCISNEMKSISLVRNISLYENNENYEDESEVFIDCSADSTDKKEPPYVLDFTFLHELLDLPIIIKDCVVSFHDFKIDDMLKNIKYKSYKTTYSLYDFIQSITFELTWWGTESKKEEIVNGFEDGICNT